MRRTALIVGLSIFVILTVIAICAAAGLGGWIVYLRMHSRTTAVEQVAVSPTEAPIVPVEEIRPGMTGYCLSPDQSGIDRLSIAVMGVQKFRGNETRIFAQVRSGRALLTGGVALGMSGSPVYLDDGRFVGVLAATLKDPDHTFFVTPANELIAQGRRAASHGYSSKIPLIPSYAAFCTVWGANSSCIFGTLSYVKDGVAFGTGHSTSGSMSSAHQMAVFSTPVIMTLNRETPARIQGMHGDFLGTMVWDGVSGSVIELGKIPRHLTVHLSMPDALEQTIYGVTDHEDTPEDLRQAISNLVTGQLDMYSDWDARIVVSFADGSESLVIEDEWTSGLSGLKQFLHEALAQSPGAIRDIQVSITQSDEKGEHELQKLQVEKSPTGIVVKSVLSGVSSHERLVERQDVSGTFTPQVGLSWYLGRDLHEKVLSLMPATKAVRVLNQLSDRRVVYLVCVECNPWETADSIQIRAQLKARGLKIGKSATMPFAIGEQKPETKAEKPTLIIAGVRH